MVDVKMIVNADLVVCFFVTVDISFVVGEKVIGSVEHSVEINIGYSNEYYISCKQFTWKDSLKLLAARFFVVFFLVFVLKHHLHNLCVDGVFYSSQLSLLISIVTD